MTCVGMVRHSDKRTQTKLSTWHDSVPPKPRSMSAAGVTVTEDSHTDGARYKVGI